MEGLDGGKRECNRLAMEKKNSNTCDGKALCDIHSNVNEKGLNDKQSE